MNKISAETLKKLTELRREIHKHPELSHNEIDTAIRVTGWLEETGPDRLISSLGGHGVAALYDSGKPGPSVLFRCELDALPIQETSTLPYRSVYEGVGHFCGHDGHMATMLGLASYIKDNRPEKGRAILLFQPAEETGTGAALVLDDEKFGEIAPDYAFALHNLPGFEKHHLILADPVYGAGSVGLEIELSGKTSHAAEPENGINPAMAVSRIIMKFDELSHRSGIFDDFILITIIQVLLGERAFGTSAGHAVVRATLRAFNEKDYQHLVRLAISEARHIAESENLQVSFNTTEEFPVTQNHPECTALIKKLAEQNEWPITWLDKPFRWSEDFGHFNRISRAALIGIGSGLDQPKLHHPDFDFPDDIIPTGVEIFSRLYTHFLKS
jgi:amidohydrolase